MSASLIDAMAAHGLTPPQHLEPGRLVRFPAPGKTPGNRAAWCWMSPDGQGAAFGDWTTGLSTTWQADRSTPMTPAERERFRAMVADAQAAAVAERIAQHAAAARKAAELWGDAVPADPAHPYLTRKRIRPCIARQHGERLVLPIVDARGELSSLQFIGPDGTKRMLTGGAKKSRFIPVRWLGADATIVVAEGFATAATLAELDPGASVIAAIDCGNLPPVCLALRDRFPKAEIVVAGDDDRRTDGNPGRTAANEAARACGGKVVFPPWDGTEPEGATDFNDWALAHGLIGKGWPMGELPPNDTVTLVRGSTITTHPVSWLWNDWIASGKLQILAGQPGAGKTTLAMSMAAVVTRGGEWPDGSTCAPGNVVIWSGEDDPTDTLAPRLMAAGADMDRVFFVDVVTAGGERRPFDPASDMPALAAAIDEAGGCALLILDPIVTAVTGDGNSNTEVRRGLQPVVDLAARLKCAVLGLTHLTKGTSGRDPLDRVTGSLAFGAVARVVMLAAKRQDAGDAGAMDRLLCRVKSNNGTDDGGFEYALRQAPPIGSHRITSVSVVWGEPVGKGWPMDDLPTNTDAVPNFLRAAGAPEAAEWPEPQPLPSGLLPVMAFDHDLLPESLRPWVSDIADRTQCPPDYVAVAAMAALGSIIGRKVAIRPKVRDSWAETPNLWALVVGRPGAMKSPAIEAALAPVKRLAARALEEYKGAEAEHKAQALAAKLRGEEMEKRAKKALASDPGADVAHMLEEHNEDAPTLRRYIAVDSNAASLGELHRQNPNGLLVHRDEMVSLLRSLDREDQAEARGFYLTGWNGNSGYTFDRIGRGLNLHIPGVCLSLLGGTQPGRLSDYIGKAVHGGAGDDGLIQRFGLLVWPDGSGEWRNVDRWPDTAAKDAAFAVFDRLDALTPEAVGATQDVHGETGEPDGLPYLRLGPEAGEQFLEWRTELEARLRSGDLHPALESHLSKYRTLVPALALICHLADDGRGPVGGASMGRALAWAEYLETHARRAYGAATSRDVEAARAILHRIKRGDLPERFASYDVWRPQWTGLPDSETAGKGLRLLVELDWLNDITEQTAGRPRTVYVVNPKARRRG